MAMSLEKGNYFVSLKHNQMTWKVSVFPAFPALMLKQHNQCQVFPDFFQIIVIFPATTTFPVSDVTLINYAQNVRFTEGICLSSTVMYRF